MINIGYTYSDPDSAISCYKAALNIAHTGHLPLLEIAAYNNLSYSYLDKGLLYEAKSCLIDYAIPLAKATNNPDWLSTLYDSYCDVLSTEGDYKQAVLYEKKSMATGAEAARQAATDQVRLLSCMLDLKNKETEIQHRDQEILVHQNKERIFRLWLGISGLGILMLLFLLFVTRLRNRLKFERERFESSRRIIGIEENEKRKLSMDLHELSGQVKMDLLEQFNHINIPEGTEKSEMTNKITSLSNHIRTISHRMSRITIDQFDIGTLIKGLCNEFREFSGLDIQLTRSDAVPYLADETKLHIFRILQEILSNAAKYAKNAQIKVEIHASGGSFKLIYSDNGQGFVTGVSNNKGMGLMNIRERANILGGKAILQSSPGLGVYWEVSVPLKGKNLQ